MENKLLVKTQAELADELPYAKHLLAELEAFVILNDEDQELVAEGLREIKGRYASLETKRKRITTPLRTAISEVNDLFRPPKEALEACEALLKRKLAEYKDSIEEQNRLALEAARSAETPEEASAVLATVVETEPAKGVSVRHVWRAEVFRPELVPYEFLSPDIAKIQAVADQAKEGEDPMPIPGVRFVKKPIVAVRAVPGGS